MGFERVSLTNVGNLLAAAGAGAAIGCALGKLQEYQLKIVNPYISKHVAATASRMGINDWKFKNTLENIFKVVFTSFVTLEVIPGGARAVGCEL